ncbi:MAG: hypothetical protein R3A46_07730 [Thermomicrobiales bacterium]
MAFPGLVMVTPGQNVDLAPFGTVNADSLWVPRGWIDAAGDINAGGPWDYALIVLADDALGSTVGTMTITALDDTALGAPDFNPTTAGYPGDKPEGTMWTGNGRRSSRDGCCLGARRSIRFRGKVVQPSGAALTS